MFEQYIQQLKSQDATKRREAIINLGKLADPRALPYLGQIYKNDSDPALRDLAAKAGRHIQKLKQEAQASADTPVPISPEAPRSNMPDILKNYTRAPEPAKPAYTPPPAADPLAMSSALASPSMIDEPDHYAETHVAASQVVEERPSSLPSILQSYTKPVAEPKAEPQSAPPRANQSARNAGGPAFEAEFAPDINVSKAKPITRADREKARDKVRHAFDAKVRGDDRGALADLAKALRLDPDLAGDSSVQALAASLVGGQGKDAIRLVMERVAEYEREKPKAATFDGEIFGMSLALIGLFVANFLFTVVYLVVIPILILVPVLQTRSTLSSGDILTLRNYAQSVLSQLLRQYLGDFLRYSAIFLGSTVFQMISVYIVGTFMGGAASIIRFIRVLATLSIGVYVWFGIIIGTFYIGLLSGSPSTLRTIVQFMLPGVGFSALGLLGVQTVLVARMQKFTWLHALASVIVGSIVAGIIATIFGLFRVSTVVP